MKIIASSKSIKKISGVIMFLASFIFATFVFNGIPVSAATNLNGRILLQVEAHGEAWYVNPVNGYRYYLGRPDDAFNVMRSLGLGITNADTANFKVNGAPLRLSGRILLQVQDKGQAYYVNPLNRKLYYLGRPTDAFNVMRSFGLGITNADLIKIRIASVGGTSSTSGTPSIGTSVPATSTSLDTPLAFNFKYKTNNYTVNQNFSSALYNSYQASTKVYSYSGATVSDASLRESFYGLFFNVKSGDTSLNDLIYKLKATALNNNWTDDETLEFTLALVQFIPYDSAKLEAGNNRNNNPYYPYETLYLDKGVCSDKTFLAVALLRRLGYGVAILDFPTANHSAVGIACPTDQSLNGTGYCYGETTNYFPLGVVPPSLSSGQAQAGTDEFTGLFDAAHLGAMEVYQKTSGQLYYGVAATRAKVASLKASKDYLNSQSSVLDAQDAALKTQEAEVSALKSQMDAYYDSGQISEYNALVATYNDLVNKYNSDLSAYKATVSDYNQKVNDFNQAVKDFYQK
ncbi:MAG: transglutaminase-like domain-containing protein [Patescibacteria group bacterium]|jgi:hypothetical protein